MEEVQTELRCQEICGETSDCSYYTFLTSSLSCLLLTDLEGPFRDCEDCRTGPADCGQGLPSCSLQHQDQESLSLLLNQSGTFTLDLGLERTCRLRLVAVGGGGPGATSFGGGGGGSGQVLVTTETVTDRRVVVRVGGPGEDSVVEVEGGETLLALAGSGGREGETVPTST